MAGRSVRSDGRSAACARAAIPVLVLGMLVGGAQPAVAACHIAAFTRTDVRVGEGDGQVRLTVELVGGQPTCQGTVTYETEDVTATAGSDYERAEGELRFVAGDDRRESFTVRIIDDSIPEGTERFRVRLTGATGTISASSEPATVTIEDDDEEPEPTTDPPAEPPAEPEEEVEEEEPLPAGQDPSPAQTPEDEEEETPAAEPETSPAAQAPSGGGGGAGLIIGLVAAGLAVVAGAAVWLRRRSSQAS